MKKFILVLTMLAVSVNVVSAEEVYGKWLSANKKLIIKIEKCDDDICGVVYKFAKKTKGKKQTKQRKKYLNKQLFKLEASRTKNRWDGKLLNLKDGNSYFGNLILLKDNKIKIEACVFFFCKSEKMTRL